MGREQAPSRHKRGRVRTGNLECTQVTEVLAINAPATEDVDYIVHHCRRVPLTWRRNEADAVQLRPCVGRSVERPCIVVVVLAISTSEAAEMTTFERR